MKPLPTDPTISRAIKGISLMPEEVEDAPKTDWKRIGPKYRVPMKLKICSS